jgi:anti-sigma B factor antagonist
MRRDVEADLVWFWPEATVANPFNIEIVEDAGSLTLVVAGELDISTSRLLDDQLARAKETDAATIVVDLDRIDFIDSSGLHVLIKHAYRDQTSQRVRLTKGSRAAQRLFALTGALDRLPFVSSD